MNIIYFWNQGHKIICTKNCVAQCYHSADGTKQATKYWRKSIEKRMAKIAISKTE